MHRCLYSIVHSDDMFELKMVMETTLGHLVVHPGNQADQNQVILSYTLIVSPFSLF